MFERFKNCFSRDASNVPTGIQTSSWDEKIARREGINEDIASQLSSGKALSTADLGKIFENHGSPSASVSNFTGELWAAKRGQHDMGSRLESQTGVGVEVRYHGRRIILLDRDASDQKKEEAYNEAVRKIEAKRGR